MRERLTGLIGVVLLLSLFTPCIAQPTNPVGPTDEGVARGKGFFYVESPRKIGYFIFRINSRNNNHNGLTIRGTFEFRIMDADWWTPYFALESVEIRAFWAQQTGSVLDVVITGTADGQTDSETRIVDFMAHFTHDDTTGENWFSIEWTPDMGYVGPYNGAVTGDITIRL